MHQKETMRLPKNLEELIEKYQNPIFFYPCQGGGRPSSLESSMKQFLRRFELNQNKSKQMKINVVFDRFASKV